MGARESGTGSHVVVEVRDSQCFSNVTTVKGRREVGFIRNRAGLPWCQEEHVQRRPCVHFSGRSLLAELENSTLLTQCKN